VLASVVIRCIGFISAAIQELIAQSTTTVSPSRPAIRLRRAHTALPFLCLPPVVLALHETITKPVRHRSPWLSEPFRSQRYQEVTRL